MKVTLETVRGSDLVYVYKNDPVEGETVDQTFIGLQTDLLFNSDGQWGGIIVFPMDEFGGTSVIFNNDNLLNSSKRARCNVDMLNGEVYGIELMLPTGMIGSTELIAGILEIKN